ncbi:uncharacterized protein AB9X84_001058 isoform 2-T2 [Acanthopagrus schlegelii]
MGSCPPFHDFQTSSFCPRAKAVHQDEEPLSLAPWRRSQPTGLGMKETVWLRELALFYRVHHVAPPSPYSSPEWTNQTPALERDIFSCLQRRSLSAVDSHRTWFQCDGLR